MQRGKMTLEVIYDAITDPGMKRAIVFFGTVNDIFFKFDHNNNKWLKHCRKTALQVS